MSSRIHESSSAIEGVQYLRGIAALMVVFFHARSVFGDVPVWTGVGARGVDIFFVISGFIIALSTRNGVEHVSVLKTSFLFLCKRIIRVVPLYWLALFWTSSAYWLNWFSMSSSFQSLFANISPEMISIFQDMAFLPHFSIDEDEEGEIFPVLITGWTLNYEMFFYVLFALAMLLPQYRLKVASGILIVLVVLGKMFHFQTIPTVFYTSSILIEFVFGMWVYEVYSRTQHVVPDRRSLLVLGLIGFFLLNSGSSINDKLVLAVASALIVYVFIQAFRNVHIRLLKLLGDASYSIYLFHLASFPLARELIQYAGVGGESMLNIVAKLCLHLLASIVVGIAVYWFIEKPMLNVLRKWLAKVFYQHRNPRV